jgi:hypothetical protein
MILLPLPPEYWDYRCAPPHLAAVAKISENERRRMGKGH